MSRRKKRHKDEEVVLNLAAMLDMAFQLLTFFILTFKPPPVEGQVALRLPPAQAVANATGKNSAGKDDKPAVDIKGVETLLVTVYASDGGNIASMGVGQDQVRNLSELATKLEAAFKDPNSPFEQVIIQSGSKLKYGDLMQVVEVCTHQTHADGRKLDKMSFVEIPDGDAK